MVKWCKNLSLQDFLRLRGLFTGKLCVCLFPGTSGSICQPSGGSHDTCLRLCIFVPPCKHVRVQVCVFFVLYLVLNMYVCHTDLSDTISVRSLKILVVNSKHFKGSHLLALQNWVSISSHRLYSCDVLILHLQNNFGCVDLATCLDRPFCKLVLWQTVCVQLLSLKNQLKEWEVSHQNAAMVIAGVPWADFIHIDTEVKNRWRDDDTFPRWVSILVNAL